MRRSAGIEAIPIGSKATVSSTSIRLRRITVGSFTRSRASMRLLAGTILAFCLQGAVGPMAMAAPPPYVTVLFSRSQWAVHENCQAPPGAITLETIAADLAARGGIGTGSVVTSRIGSTAMRCTGTVLYPTWSILARLHTNYGWESTSHSATYANLTQLSRDRQFAESCGTLLALEDHGFHRAWGMFSYPYERSSLIQTEVVSTCFTFGRRYSATRNKLATMTAPWWAKVRSVNGGACNDAAAPCSAIGTRYRYVDPALIADFVGVLPGQWAVVQFHKLVAGAKLNGAVRWDCTATDWHRHFTSRTEMYCWNDYLKILNAIPGGAVVTDPATVARSWGANTQVLQRHP